MPLAYEGRLFGFRQLRIAAVPFGALLVVLSARGFHLMAAGAPSHRTLLGLASSLALAAIFTAGAASGKLEAGERVFSGLVVLAALGSAVLSSGVCQGGLTPVVRAFDSSATLAIAIMLLAAGIGPGRGRSEKGRGHGQMGEK